jgi:hypothetical protein
VLAPDVLLNCPIFPLAGNCASYYMEQLSDHLVTENVQQNQPAANDNPPRVL